MLNKQDALLIATRAASEQLDEMVAAYGISVALSAIANVVAFRAVKQPDPENAMAEFLAMQRTIFEYQQQVVKKSKCPL